MAQNNELTFADVALKDFKKNNPQSIVKIENGDSIVIEKPWGRSDARIKLSVSEHGFIEELNKMAFNPRFDAVFHVDQKQIEFLYSYVHPTDPEVATYCDRIFTLYFEGQEYKCGFLLPSERLLSVAAHFERQPSEEPDRSVPQINQFKDAQRLPDIPQGAQKYFQGRVPRCFFVEAAKGFDGVNVESLIRHLNFLIYYYDRSAPLVVIKEPPATNRPGEYSPLRMIDAVFPDTLVSPGGIDDVVMRLIEVAGNSSVRAAYIYYYQVFEYSGYYYVDDKTRNQLRNVLRDPALICCNEDRVSELFGIFSDLNQSDEVKMRKVIEDNCDPKVIWKEILNDYDFFSLPQQFEGGFNTAALIAKDTSEATWGTMWMPKTFDLLTKIRNVLVHAREKRESKVILPTPSNNAILRRYLPLMARIAEQLAIKT